MKKITIKDWGYHTGVIDPVLIDMNIIDINLPVWAAFGGIQRQSHCAVGQWTSYFPNCCLNIAIKIVIEK